MLEQPTISTYGQRLFSVPNAVMEHTLTGHNQQITLGTGELSRNLLQMGAEHAAVQTPETCGYRLGTFF